MTRRERLERKLEKREEWAGKAEARSAEKFSSARAATEAIPFGQPILIGHHSEKRHRRAIAQGHSRMSAGVELADKAKHHASKADGISAQLDSSIFSDDADAIEQLESRIAEREAERDRWKEFNASCRKGKPDPTLLDEEQRKNLAVTMRVCPYQIGKKGQAPGYILTNLGGVIRADRERIKSIKIRAERAQRAEDAGGVLIAKSSQGDYCSVTFAERPDYSVIKSLKAAGFHWSGGGWHGNTSKLPEGIET